MTSSECNALLERLGLAKRVNSGDLLGSGLFPILTVIVDRLERLEAKLEEAA